MKVLYINTLYSPYIRGGAELSLKLLVEGMQAKGHEVVVLSMVPEQGLKVDFENGVKVYRAGLKNFYWPYSEKKHPTANRMAWHFRDSYNAGMKSYVAEVLEKEKPDLVSCHNLAGWSVAVYDEIQKFGVPIIQVLHDLYLLCANSNMYKGDSPCDKICLSCKILRINHQKQSLKVTAVVGISKSILGRFEQQGYFANAQKYVIHNTRSIPDPGPKEKRIGNIKLRIGYLGTLSQIKGIEWLMAEFQHSKINASLLIAGKGKSEYEDFLQTKVNDLRIQFLGQVVPAEFFKEIDVLVVPSLWEEPLGMVAIEALAHHIPVIANRAGGLKETVIDGVNGLFCEAKNPNSLGNAMEKLSSDADLYNWLSGNARDSVSEILDGNRLIQAYEKVMENAIKTKRT
ncbi:glycosyltransferase family 4 protein [Aquiflexum sp. TKW24L]|uniref:glycosyltransferase family 4 protein n=1 Tax=Aquiflexum sp. TKW24L TaxID=2942212 RepID=UPI0020C18839|nr:glycosyltransferase family 4 protein [Aquiflexum sp. TKW24L]MCL6260680.1 glycosyltransferase family 4 protein [Aquiflexum sp. TKW24L]